MIQIHTGYGAHGSKREEHGSTDSMSIPVKTCSHTDRRISGDQQVSMRRERPQIERRRMETRPRCRRLGLGSKPPPKPRLICFDLLYVHISEDVLDSGWTFCNQKRQ
jgi:hypothetical protein